MLLYHITLITSFSVVLGHANARANNFTEDYCWRDYVGIIPIDALPGGLDKRGKPIYIGQALHEDKLIPGQIFISDDHVHFEAYVKSYSINRNVKILCTDKPDAFNWIDAKSENVSQLALTKILVHGGYEPNYFTYIGRAVTDGETNVGKVMCGLDTCLGLFVTHDYSTVEHKVFQILVYSHNSIDVRADIA